MIQRHKKHIKLRGIDYAYTEWVKEPVPTSPDRTMIFLHGFMGSGAIFEEFANELLSNITKDYRVIALDIIGHGHSEGAEMHYRFSTQEQVADLRSFIERMSDHPVVLMGYSMGARLALSLALRYPKLLVGLILESGSFGIIDPTEAQTRQSLDGHRADELRANYSEFVHQWNRMPLFSTKHSKPLPKKYTTIQREQDPYWMANSLLGFGSGTMPCVHDQLCSLDTPTQLLVGGDDTKFIAINQRMHQQIPNSYLSIIRESGHRVHNDAPKQWLSTIQSFIQLYL